MKQIYIILLFIILLIYIYHLHQEYNKLKLLKNPDRDKFIDYFEIIQKDRIISMNGLKQTDSEEKQREIIKNSVDFSFHYLLFNLFNEFIIELDKNKIDYFLLGGSLIGYHRHNNGFIPWDDDIDIGVFEEDKQKIYDIIKEMNKKNSKFSLINSLVDKLAYGKFNGNPIQIDLFYFKYFEGKKYYDFANEKQRQLWQGQYITKDEIYPLINSEFKLYLPDGKLYNKINVKIPNKSKKYLDRCYPDWENKIEFQKPHVKYYEILYNM